MAKWLIIALILLVVSVVITLAIKGLVDILWDGSLDSLSVREIATYDSPDGAYTLVFEQIGSPFLFGPADVRLTLRDSQGVFIDQISAKVFNDGGSAYPGNIKSIRWSEDKVVVILESEENPDQGFTFFLT